jgi:hypothetical protein
LTNYISSSQWIKSIQAEYLDDFVREGGSAVKFVVPMAGDELPEIKLRLQSLAAQSDFLVASVDARDTKVHLMQELFFSIAGQVDWRKLARRVIVRLAGEYGYKTGYSGELALLPGIAEASGLDPVLVRSELNRNLNLRVFRHRGLAKDFRVAMAQLCLAELSGGEDGANSVRVLTDWLTGQNRRIAAVKPYSIFNTLTRTNSRYMFESLLHWIRFAEYPGLVVILDIARVTMGRNPRDGDLYYSRAAVLDVYEVLRQFIDATDKLEGCLFLVLPDVEFLSEETFDRGFGAYEALKFRVYDEIRDRELVNPMSSLVRLSG